MIFKSPHTCKETFLSMRGPFFHKLALVEKFKEIFQSSNFDPFFSSALQPSSKSYCFETHFTFQSGNCTCFYQILSLYLYWFSDGKGFKIALNFSRCSKLFAPTVLQNFWSILPREKCETHLAQAGLIKVLWHDVIFVQRMTRKICFSRYKVVTHVVTLITILCIW